MGKSCGGLSTKIHAAVDALGNPIRLLLTPGQASEYGQAEALIEGFACEAVLADKGYDVDAFIKLAVLAGMSIVIPPKCNRKAQREYDRDLYKLRHLVENAFLHLKQWRGIATRYAKNASSFLAAVHIRCIAIWAKFY